MKQDEIFELLKAGMIELFEFDPNELTKETLIYEDLDIDSIDAIDLVDFMRNKTGYRMLPEDFKNIKTLGDIANIIEKKLEENSDI